MKTPDWKKWLPEEMAAKLEGKDNIVRIAANSFWLLSDKLLRMFVTLFVTGWLARYLSVDEFGKLNNAIAYAALFGSFATLGLDSIVIRDIVRFPEKKDSVVGTAFYLKLFAGILTWLLSALCVVILRPTEGETISRLLVYIISAGILFQSFDVIDFYFQSQVKSKYTVFAKNSAFIIISLVKIVMIWQKLPLIYFGWAWLAEMVMNAVGLVLVYRRKNHEVGKWK
ncbi:MAG: oligosaccharide flippase family protein, partial [Bacteroidetes bacterium]|nr:oligosaccharide flippase family protein [Bacteroidota bacterium]